MRVSLGIGGSVSCGSGAGGKRMKERKERTKERKKRERERREEEKRGIGGHSKN